eukprot:157882_1
MKKKRLFEMKINEENEMQKEAERIKKEIETIETQRKHHKLLIKWKMERAKLNNKRTELIHDLNNKYFKEFQQLKQNENTNVNNDKSENININNENDNSDQKNNEKIIPTLTEQTLSQFESLQNVNEKPQQKNNENENKNKDVIAIGNEEKIEKKEENNEDDDMKLMELPHENINNEMDIKSECNDNEKQLEIKHEIKLKYKAKAFSKDFNFIDLYSDKEYNGMNATKTNGAKFIYDYNMNETYIPIGECIKQSIFGGTQLQSYIVDKVTLFL